MNYEETSKSKFNAGVALAERIDSLQRAMNAARFNPRDFNPETKTFNFQIFISAADGLAMEGWSKFDRKEREMVSRVRAVIKKFQENKPSYYYDAGMDGETEFMWNEKNFDILMRLLEIYEKTIKDSLEHHDLNSPNKDDDDDGL